MKYVVDPFEDMTSAVNHSCDPQLVSLWKRGKGAHSLQNWDSVLSRSYVDFLLSMKFFFANSGVVKSVFAEYG